jgi:hypothetical protein
VSDLAKAKAELDRRIVAEENALAALSEADTAVEVARAAFAADPSSDLEEAVEVAEREQRRAKRFADVHAQGRVGAEHAHVAALRAAAAARLAKIVEARTMALGAVGRLIDDALALYGDLAALVTRAHEVVQLDVDLVTDARAAADDAGVQFRAEALTLPTLRLAIGTRLYANWEPPPLPAPERPAGEFYRLLDAFHEPGTTAQRRGHLRRLVEAGCDLFGAEPAAWLALAPRPDWTEGGTYQLRHDDAQRLLNAIEGSNEHDDDQEAKPAA